MLFYHCGHEKEIVKGNVGWKEQTKNIFIQHFIQYDSTMLDEMLDSFS